MGDVQGARIKPAVLIAAVPRIIVIVRRGGAAGAGPAVDAIALGRVTRRRAVPVQVPGIIRRVYIIVTATEACTRVFRGLRGFTGHWTTRVRSPLRGSRSDNALTLLTGSNEINPTAIPPSSRALE